MFCPQCKAEYRAGFTRCSDCDRDLVERLSESVRCQGGEPSEESLRIAYTTDYQNNCVYICRRFSEAGIPFRVFQQNRQVLRDLEQAFAIGVPADFYNRAKELTREGQMDFTEDDQRIMELPAGDKLLADQRTENNWDPKRWNSKAATVEIWYESAQKRTWMIELSLRENRIHARTDVLPDGSRRILVMPGDEFRAREIVREIKDGAPPA
jgi:hypothetical protein